MTRDTNNAFEGAFNGSVVIKDDHTAKATRTINRKLPKGLSAPTTGWSGTVMPPHGGVYSRAKS